MKLRCAKALKLKGLNSSRPYFIQFSMAHEIGKDEFFDILAEEIQKPLDPMELLYPGEVPLFEKYDEYLPEELIRKGFAYGVLDTEGMRERIEGWLTL